MAHGSTLVSSRASNTDLKALTYSKQKAMSCDGGRWE